MFYLHLLHNLKLYNVLVSNFEMSRWDAGGHLRALGQDNMQLILCAKYICCK